MIIKHLHIDALAHIKEIEFEDTNGIHFCSKQEWITNGLKASNIEITETSALVNREWYNARIVQLNRDIKILHSNYFIDEIYYEYAGYGMKDRALVTKISIKYEDSEQLKELLGLGGKQDTHKKSVWFDRIQLISLIRNNMQFRTWCDTNDIEIGAYGNLFIDNLHKIRRIKLTEDITNKQQIEKWETKAKVLGFNDNKFIINKNIGELEYYLVEHNKTSLIPPVRELSSYVFLDNFERIVIPDSVYTIHSGIEHGGNIKEVIIGKNTVNISDNFTYGLYEIEELDLQNVMSVPSLYTLHKLRKLRFRIDASAIWTGLHEATELNYIELVEGPYYEIS